MRTTVTLDKDVERMLRDAMRRERRSFKQALNAAVRASLSKRPGRGKGARFVIRARPMRLRAGIDPAGFNKLADALEIDAFMEKNKRTRRK